MDAREHLSGLDDPADAAFAQFRERPAPRTIDSGQPEDMQRQVGNRLPLLFGHHPPAPARSGRGQRRRLIHPGAVMVAIDGGG